MKLFDFEHVQKFISTKLMDVPETATWRDLGKLADDRDYWKERVRKLTQSRVHVNMGRHFEVG